MIFNRTYNDIVRAKRIFAEKVQKFIALSSQETAVIDKAFFNLKAINRITSKIIEIWERITEAGGNEKESGDIREWDRKEIFRKANFENIIGNIGDAIETLGYLGIDTSNLEKAYSALNSTYTHTNLNNLEKLLQDIGIVALKLMDIFAYQIDEKLYILGAYEVYQEGSVLIIE